MEFIAEEHDSLAHTPTLRSNEADAEELGVHPLDRVQATSAGRTDTGVVEVMRVRGHDEVLVERS